MHGNGVCVLAAGTACAPKPTEDTPAAAETTAAAETSAAITAETQTPWHLRRSRLGLRFLPPPARTETLTEIAEMYKKVAPNVTIAFNFDSSGTLATQIQEGAECDLFISAAQKQMNAIDSTSDKEKSRQV